MDCAEIVEVFEASKPANISIPYDTRLVLTALVASSIHSMFPLIHQSVLSMLSCVVLVEI